MAILLDWSAFWRTVETYIFCVRILKKQRIQFKYFLLKTVHCVQDFKNKKTCNFFKFEASCLKLF